ncbi:Mur ligase [Fimicolochytrium jonesii]|uniref:Mur ligase n=1 Tax=Fimicolochytrium jonesii TaxID=1396493 RepID=UPI0022FEE052|nr:Mur ligase [Fimicolochytrium jonesii]KAI8821993.1 Mur ligase [Fimicolochytrium jonesii]
MNAKPFVTMQRTYEDAVQALNSLQTNAAVLEQLRKAGNAMNQRSMPEMIQYVERIGYKVSDLNKLNVVHVAGTKGKGSTSAISDSILRRLRRVDNGGVERNIKTGLFTSPHLIEARERIRINGDPIEKQLFAKYFFEVWDALGASRATAPGFENTPQRPQYFRYLTLMAIHTFLQEQVDAVVLEVGMGGEYDSTNVVEKPIVCGITALGYDHTPLLGTTLAEIAWHKAGIMKTGVPVISAPQPAETIPVLEKRAEERQVARYAVIDSKDFEYVQKRKLGLPGAYQQANGALAVRLCQAWIEDQKIKGVQFVNEQAAIDSGLENAKWPGRAQKYVTPDHPGVTWYLDGAHTKESMQVCADWFEQEQQGSVPSTDGQSRVLIFNCTKGRDGIVLLKSLVDLHRSSLPFSRVIFCSNDAYRPDFGPQRVDQINNTVFRDEELLIQKELAAAWRTLSGSEGGAAKEVPIEIQPSIDDAVRSIVTDTNAKQNVLVTGSLYLIGGLLTVLKAPTM